MTPCNRCGSLELYHLCADGKPVQMAPHRYCSDCSEPLPRTPGARSRCYTCWLAWRGRHDEAIVRSIEGGATLLQAAAVCGICARDISRRLYELRQQGKFNGRPPPQPKSEPKYCERCGERLTRLTSKNDRRTYIRRFCSNKCRLELLRQRREAIDTALRDGRARGVSWDEIAANVGLKRRELLAKAAALGLRELGSKTPRCSEEQITTLRRMVADDYSAVEIMAALNRLYGKTVRTPEQLLYVCRRIGIHPPRGSWSRPGRYSKPRAKKAKPVLQAAPPKPMPILRPVAAPAPIAPEPPKAPGPVRIPLREIYRLHAEYRELGYKLPEEPNLAVLNSIIRQAEPNHPGYAMAHNSSFRLSVGRGLEEQAAGLLE